MQYEAIANKIIQKVEKYLNPELKKPKDYQFKKIKNKNIK